MNTSSSYGNRGRVLEWIPYETVTRCGYLPQRLTLAPWFLRLLYYATSPLRSNVVASTSAFRTHHRTNRVAR